MSATIALALVMFYSPVWYYHFDVFVLLLVLVAPAYFAEDGQKAEDFLMRVLLAHVDDGPK